MIFSLAWLKGQSLSKNKTSFQAVVFDLFGTLADEPTSKSTNTNQLISEMFSIEFSEFQEYWRNSVKERLSGSSRSTYAYFQEMLNKLEVSVDASYIEHAVKARTEFAEDVLIPRKSAIGAIKEIRKSGMKVGLVSNCGIEIVNAWQQSQFPDLIDRQVLSAEVGLIKPDRQIYNLICEYLDVDPLHCFYVGDGGDWELSGAEAFGMTAALLQVDYESHTDVSYKQEAENWEGLKLESLDKIAELLH